MSQFTTASISKLLFFPSWFCPSLPALLLILLGLSSAFSAGIQRKHCLTKVLGKTILFPRFLGATLMSHAPGSFTTLIRAFWLAAAQGRRDVIQQHLP